VWTLWIAGMDWELRLETVGFEERMDFGFDFHWFVGHLRSISRVFGQNELGAIRISAFINQHKWPLN